MRVEYDLQLNDLRTQLKVSEREVDDAKKSGEICLNEERKLREQAEMKLREAL
jgi:hypothetical protein